jgi:hypothetical protein
LNRGWLVFWLAGLLALPGCVGDHQGRQDVSQGQAPAGRDARPTGPNRKPVLEDLPESRGELTEALRKIDASTQSSNNATQQSLSGLGLQVGKVAERVDAALVKFEADVQVSIRQEVAAQFESNIKASLEAKAEVEARVQAKAFSDFCLELRNELRVQAQAQAAAAATAQGNAVAALRSEISQSTATLTAGRDNIQITPEMMKVLLASIGSMESTALAVVGIVIGCMSAATGIVALLSRYHSQDLKVFAGVAEDAIDEGQRNKETKRVQPKS